MFFQTWYYVKGRLAVVCSSHGSTKVKPSVNQWLVFKVTQMFFLFRYLL